MVRMDPVDYDDVAEGVRRFCAERYYELEKSLRPLVDGSFGDVLPGHLAAYLAAVRQLGKLYQVEKPPRSLEDLIPTTKVQELLARMEHEHQRALEQAVQETEDRVRRELESGSKMAIERGQRAVMTRLMELESRAS